MAIPATPGKRVLVIAPLVDGWLIFYTKTLSNAGYDVTLVTDTTVSARDQDHVNVLYNFARAPFCRLMDISDVATFDNLPFDFALAGIHGATPQGEKDRLMALIGKIPVRAVIFRRYNTRFPSMLRLLVKEIMHPFLRRSGRVMVEWASPDLADRGAKMVMG